MSLLVALWWCLCVWGSKVLPLVPQLQGNINTAAHCMYLWPGYPNHFHVLLELRRHKKLYLLSSLRQDSSLSPLWCHEGHMCHTYVRLFILSSFVPEEMMQRSTLLGISYCPHHLPCQPKEQDQVLNLFSVFFVSYCSPHPRLLLPLSLLYLLLKQKGNSLREQGLYLISKREVEEPGN